MKLSGLNFINLKRTQRRDKKKYRCISYCKDDLAIIVLINCYGIFLLDNMAFNLCRNVF